MCGAPAPLAARASPSRPAFAAFSGNPIAPGVACALVFALRSVIAAISRRTSSTMDCSRSLWRRCRNRSTRWFALRATRQTNANDTHVLHCCVPTFVSSDRAVTYIILYSSILYYIILYIILYYTISIIRRPRLQQGERVRGGITSSKGQEVITSSKGKKQENKKEEARSKKQLQATSGKKQETRSQEATSGWKTGQRASFLVDSESNGGWKTAQRASFLVGSRSSESRGPQARSVPQGPAVLVWRRRRL